MMNKQERKDEFQPILVMTQIHQPSILVDVGKGLANYRAEASGRWHRENAIYLGS